MNLARTLIKGRFPSARVFALSLCATFTGLFSATAVIGPSGGLTATPSGGDLILSFPTTTTNYYGVQWCPDLSQPWVNVQAGLQGYGALKATTMSNALASSRGFYRTVIQPKPTQLLLSQSTAFAILGYDCGGIQEKVYAIGFDPTNGYPTGNVDLRTSCSTGKAGSPPAVHTASVFVTWDFAGNAISTSVPAAGAPASATFIATDKFNDILFNYGANAYLIVPIPLAPTNVAAAQSGDEFLVSWMSSGVNPIAITSSALTATPVNSANPVLTAIVNGSLTNGIIPTLQPATTYQITVVNTTIGGAGPASAPVSVTTSPATVLPSAPTNVVAVWQIPDPTTPTDSITVTWSAAIPGNSPVDEYQIIITNDSGGAFTNTVSGTTLTTYFNGMDYIPNYAGTVQAHNTAGWGPVSAAFHLGGL